MGKVALELPDDALLALKLDEQAATQHLRLAAAVKLYELGRLSSGAAATVAGIPRVAFLEKLADFGVPAIKHTAEEPKRDFENA